MSGSTEPRAALVPPEDQATMIELIDIQRDTIRFNEQKQIIRTDTGGADERCTVLAAHPRSADGATPPTTDYRPTAADYGPTDEAVPAPTI
jgi:hypothetical protein